ncbi:heavy-metal-associated domain-containing protein [Agromyces sp. SYSU K20354]|uniref:heavy-metal-associated domain-containing protein n=1 Tax=Agromyces cavernae TaxID=2898659 RepID=UPI001E30F986|nr:heavy-metal-associated domain-containing protein [Agromyces cavernae]MCD2440944.1 heavy-metal-associated domain-containing protein [Agromyces cavernae]
MNAGARLGLFGGGLALAFVAAFGIAALVVPDSLVAAWAKGSEMEAHGEGHTTAAQPTEDPVNGVSLSAGGFVLTSIDGPARPGETGELSFRIERTDGEPVTEYTESHDKQLHLIVVRSDGARFRHVHPTLDAATGTWSTPWEWAEAGTYRVFADFTPAGDDADGVTLTRTVQVAGEYAPVTAEPSRVDEVGGFTATIDGDLVGGAARELTITISRDGEPVTTLEPYLGAFGHLVALRDGDLAYVHVHAEGDHADPGDTAGPAIEFVAQTPTAGRYLLYLDFKVDGRVHTAEFVLDAAQSGVAEEAHGDAEKTGGDAEKTGGGETHSEGH